MGGSEVWGPEGDHLLVVCLTGGIASGKSEVDREFERLGACVIDADDLARDVVLPGRPAYNSIVGEFSDRVLAPDGLIDRKALADIVFENPALLGKLNAITHPAIFQAIRVGIEGYSRSMRPGDVPAVIVDAALIVDVGAASLFDLIIVVTAPADVRVKRMVTLRGMTGDEARARIAAQVPDEKRVSQAQVVIENSGTIDDLSQSVRRAWDELKREAFSRYPAST